MKSNSVSDSPRPPRTDRRLVASAEKAQKCPPTFGNLIGQSHPCAFDICSRVLRILRLRPCKTAYQRRRPDRKMAACDGMRYGYMKFLKRRVPTLRWPNEAWLVQGYELGRRACWRLCRPRRRSKGAQYKVNVEENRLASFEAIDIAQDEFLWSDDPLRWKLKCSHPVRLQRSRQFRIFGMNKFSFNG